MSNLLKWTMNQGGVGQVQGHSPSDGPEGSPRQHPAVVRGLVRHSGPGQGRGFQQNKPHAMIEKQSREKRGRKMQEPRTYGPFVHTLNKGGLKQICISSSLKGTAASNHLANDRLAVRAYIGSFELQKKNKNWSGRQSTHIEFLSFTPPRPNLPPGYAEWDESQLQEGYLPIQILRVVNGEGEAIGPVL